MEADTGANARGEGQTVEVVLQQQRPGDNDTQNVANGGGGATNSNIGQTIPKPTPKRQENWLIDLRSDSDSSSSDDEELAVDSEMERDLVEFAEMKSRSNAELHNFFHSRFIRNMERLKRNNINPVVTFIESNKNANAATTTASENMDVEDINPNSVEQKDAGDSSLSAPPKTIESHPVINATHPHAKQIVADVLPSTPTPQNSELLPLVDPIMAQLKLREQTERPDLHLRSSDKEITPSSMITTPPPASNPWTNNPASLPLAIPLHPRISSLLEESNDRRNAESTEEEKQAAKALMDMAEKMAQEILTDDDADIPVGAIVEYSSSSTPASPVPVTSSLHGSSDTVTATTTRNPINISQSRLVQYQSASSALRNTLPAPTAPAQSSRTNVRHTTFVLDISNFNPMCTTCPTNVPHPPASAPAAPIEPEPNGDDSVPMATQIPANVLAGFMHWQAEQSTSNTTGSSGMFMGVQDDDFEYSELEVPSESEFPDNPIENYDSTSASPSPPSVVRIRPEQAIRNSEPLQTETIARRQFRNIVLTSGSSVDNGSFSEMAMDTSNVSIFAPRATKERTCLQCDTVISGLYLFCVRCFKIRRNWLPKRPPSRRLKARKRLLYAAKIRLAIAYRPPMNGNSSRNPIVLLDRIDADSTRTRRASPPHTENKVDLNLAFLAPEDNPDSRMESSSPVPENPTSISKLMSPPNPQKTNEDELQTILPRLNLEAPSKKQDDKDEEYEPVVKKSKHSQTSSDDGEKCHMCFTRKKDSAFVHNKIAHFCCCYTCGDKILKRDGKCPICRERVLRLVKIIDV